MRKFWRKKSIRRFLAGLFVMGAMVFCLSRTASASEYDISSDDNGITIDAYLSENGQVLYRVNGQDTNNSEIKITGPSTYGKRLVINCHDGASVGVIFSDLNISLVDNAAVVITGTGDVTIELDGENTLKSGDYYAGLQKENKGKLIIKDDDKNGKLTVQGGQYGAGIGGGNKGSADNIIIKGGTIAATGGNAAAGIGGGYEGSAENIIIQGGKITAEGGYCGAGIGGGIDGEGHNIEISGNANVTATGVLLAAGIGGGQSKSGYDITISGNAEVTATGGLHAAGIGSGTGGAGGKNITVKGSATVIAVGGDGAAGIGGAHGGGGAYDIHIWEKAVVSASGGKCSSAEYGEGAGIGYGGTPAEGNGFVLPIGWLTDTGGQIDLEFEGDIRYYAPGTSAASIEDGSATQENLVTIAFYANGGKGTMESVVVTKDLPKALPACTFTKDGFKIDSWTTNADGSGDSYADGEKVAFSADTDLYVQWKEVPKTVTVVGGSAPVPTAYMNDIVTITADEPEVGEGFVQWASDDGITFDNAADFVTTFKMPNKDVTVTAVTAEILIEGISKNGYDYTGSEIIPDTLIVSFMGVDLALVEGDDYELVFKDNTNPGEATVTVNLLKGRVGSKSATFKINGKTARWLDAEDKEILVRYYPKDGDIPTFTGEEPKKAATDKYSYAFSKWDNGTVEGDVTTFKPVFKESINTYVVKFTDEDGTVLQSSEVAYDGTPEYKGETPKGAKDVVCTATFTGWTPEIAKVTGAATYTAVYEKKDHVFDQENADGKYLKSAADCTHKTVYYKSCKCGEKGTETFEYGEPVGHKWKAATGAAPKTCEVCGLTEGDVISYIPTGGNTIEWESGDITLTFKRSEQDELCFANYKETQIDKKTTKVSAKAGSTIITIDEATLKALSAGEHTITVVFADATSDVKLVIKEAEKVESPKTGDGLPMGMITAMALVALLGAVGVMVQRRRAAAK